MEQGDTFSEGISLQDETYDGQGSKWDRRVEVEQLNSDTNNNENSVNIFHRNEIPYSDSAGYNRYNNSEGESEVGTSDDSGRGIGEDSSQDANNRPRELLTGGVGQLTDKIEGANSFTMDIGFGLGMLCLTRI